MLKKRRRNKKDDFKPDSKQIEKAVDEFLKQGGRINKIEKLPPLDDRADRNDIIDTDDFLMGGNSISVAGLYL